MKAGIQRLVADEGIQVEIMPVLIPALLRICDQHGRVVSPSVPVTPIMRSLRAGKPSAAAR